MDDSNGFIRYQSTKDLLLKIEISQEREIGPRVDFENYERVGYNILYGNYINNMLLDGINI